jgi:hypothetical protein
LAPGTPFPCLYDVPKNLTTRFVGAPEHYADALRLLEKSADYAMVLRGVPRSLVMKCPDNCGDVITLNLDKRTGPAWRMYGDPARLTLYPSVWRETGCEAHFIVWRGHIFWCMGESYEQPMLDKGLVDLVRRRLPKDKFVSYESIANEIDVSPWETLWACNQLVNDRVALKGPKWTFKASGDKGRS